MKKLVLASIILAFVVVILGAYTRLSDAGLGCPDWPGCYGKMLVPSHPEAVDAAEMAYPERPLEAHKAWKEMVHRYFAGALGLFILAIALMSIRVGHGKPFKLPLVLLGLVIFQAALGMWTVTMNLMPAVVMGHLLGGFSVFSLLFLLYLRLKNFRIPGGDYPARRLTKYATIGLFVLVGQIALGGWTSANYAALACTQLPICEGNWVERLDFADALSIPVADDYEFGKHSYEGRMTMHIMHRFGAIVTFIYLCWLGLKLYTKAASDMVKTQAAVMTFILGVQVLLGISNVVFKLPIWVAVMHNGVAALLLLTLVLINYTLYRKT
ncbi:COX15/CtaA family protein [Paraneptunicella aestuarii]|uniref:COX15/CtaA family protein n=1 Tax=Paraneptunicella aestuarii TaxID=2831148 RepID=UPI001E337221|nr:COX15/CtaA family protein [Paraneptunicella aestuarii]UAA38872.1 COX15/CtaA family protein [Paraneptunicella aestuarii]